MANITKTQHTVAVMALNGFSKKDIADKLNISIFEVENILNQKNVKMYINELEARDIEIQIKKYSLEKIYSFLPKLIDALGQRIEKTNDDKGLKMTDVKLLEILMKEVPKIHSEQMQKIINITQNFYENSLVQNNNTNDKISEMISRIPSYKQDLFWKDVENLINKYLNDDYQITQKQKLLTANQYDEQ